jgi:choice-of-anchor A domain-containing protein
MIVNLKSNIYATRNFSKTSAGTLAIEGSINCNGDLTVQGGSNELNKERDSISYAISCKGTVTLANGKSDNYIYYKTALVKLDTWESYSDLDIPFNALPGFQEEYDLIGYLNYLLTLVETGTKTFAGGIYNLKGYRTKSINVYDLIASNLSSTVEIKIGPNQGSTHLMKVDSPLSPVVISNLVMNTTGVKPSPEDIIFAIDTPSISISNSTLFGTIYAPNSIVTITDSEIQGSIVAKDVIVVGTGSTTIKNKLFLGYIESPVAPEIKMSPLSSVDNYTELDVSVYSDDPIPDYYEIRYTLDGTIPTRSSSLYVGNFTVYVLGVVNVKAKIFGNGVEDGNVASQAYGFKCKTENPSLVKDSLTGRYSISYPVGANVYYTLDGSDPTVYSTLYEQPAFESIFDAEGSYYIRFIAILKGCDPSDMVDETIIVELPDGGVYPPRVTILKKNSSNVYVPIYTIDPTPNTELNPNINKPKTYVFGKKASGEAPDPNVIELLTSEEFTITDVMNMKFSMSPYTAGDAIRYSMNEGNPVSGINYIGDQINISSLSSNRLRAFSHVDWEEYSQQIDYTILFRTIDSKQFDTSENELKSEEVLASLQGGSSYAIDIAWVGPGVVTDDFAVYQALINILATDMLERIFNPTFGVSISAKLAEVHKISSGEKVIADLKAEVEAQDARIKIKEELSYAYFDDELGALVVDLVWVNTLTKNSAALKYAYDLDTIR